jgi:hypothetical protein
LFSNQKSNSTVIGTATFIENDGFVTMVAKLKGLTPGVHAIHIHEKSDCTAADGSSREVIESNFQEKLGEGEAHKGILVILQLVRQWTHLQQVNGELVLQMKQKILLVKD